MLTTQRRYTNSGHETALKVAIGASSAHVTHCLDQTCQSAQTVSDSFIHSCHFRRFKAVVSLSLVLLVAARRDGGATYTNR